MSFKRFASFRVVSAVLVPTDASQETLRRVAARHEFTYEPKPGFLYVRSRAISSRTNDNYDEFPAEEIEKSYRSFVGKPVFVNHVNSNHRRMRGVCIDAALHKHTLADGSPDTWCEVLMEIDATKFPKLAKAILEKRVDRTSMGCDVAYSICSACGNKASTPAEYCQHIPRLKGKKILRRNASTGVQESHLIRETCFGLSFFENSVLVEPPADPTAHFLGVDDRGLKMATATKTAAAKDWTQVSSGEHRHTSGAKIVRETYFSDNPRKMPPAGWYPIGPNGEHLAMSPSSDLRQAKSFTERTLQKKSIKTAARLEGDDQPCNCGEPALPASHDHGQHMAWEGSLPCQGGHCEAYPEPHSSDQHFEKNKANGLDAWGRPVKQPYDGHSAYSCNNYDCTEHPQALYDEKPGPQGMPGWMQHEHDPDRDIKHEVGKAFHEQGLTEDASWLLDQQHTGPTKFSLLQHFASTHKTAIDDTNPSNHIHVGDHDGSSDGPCGFCGEPMAYHPHLTKGEWARCKDCGKDMSHHIHDKGRFEHLAREQQAMPIDHKAHIEDLWRTHGRPYGEEDEPCDHPYCVESGFAEGEHTKGEHIDPAHLDPNSDQSRDLAKAMEGIGGEDAEWLLSQNRQGPTKYSAKDSEGQWRGPEHPDLYDEDWRTCGHNNEAIRDHGMVGCDDCGAVSLDHGSRLVEELGKGLDGSGLDDKGQGPTKYSGLTQHFAAGIEPTQPEKAGENRGVADFFNRFTDHMAIQHGIQPEHMNSAANAFGVAPFEQGDQDKPFAKLRDVSNVIKLMHGLHHHLHAQDYRNPAGRDQHTHDHMDPITTHPSSIYDHPHPTYRDERSPVADADAPGVPDYDRTRNYGNLHPDRPEHLPNLKSHHDPEDPDTWTNLSACPQVYPQDEERDFEPYGEEKCDSCGAFKDMHASYTPSQEGKVKPSVYRERGQGFFVRHQTKPLVPLKQSENTKQASSADRWVGCEQGHRHWGANGAAGVLIRHTDDEGTRHFLLQHRAPWVDEGNTFSVPGGALHRGETPEQGARREAEEEIGSLPSGLRHVHTHSDEHGGWAYHTVIMDTPHRFDPSVLDDETGEHGSGWFTHEEISHLPLHSGFAKTWQGLSAHAVIARKKKKRKHHHHRTKEQHPYHSRGVWGGGWGYGWGVGHPGYCCDSGCSGGDGGGSGDGGGGDGGGGTTAARTASQEPCGECGKPKDHIHIQVSQQMRDMLRAIDEASKTSGEMHDSAQKRVVNLDDPHDLKAHLMEAHSYGPDDFWRNSHDDDHPALGPFADDDRPLTHMETRRLHDWEHGHGIVNEHPDYNGGDPGHFMDNMHFHTASLSASATSKTAMGPAQCAACDEPIRVNPNTTTRQGEPIPNDGWYHHDGLKRDHPARPHDYRSADDQRTHDRARMDQARMEVRDDLHWKFRELEMQREGKKVGQTRVWPVRVKIKDRSTGRYTGTHVGNPQASFKQGTDQVDRRSWPFRVCEEHLGHLKGDIDRHNTESSEHPHTYEVEHDTWPLDPTSTKDISSCDACVIGSVNKAFAAKTAAGRNLERHEVPAEEVATGDYLDIGGKVRVHNTHTRGEKVMLAWRLKGSKAPGVRQHKVGETVHVWRPAAKEAVRKSATWIGDHPEEPTLFWRAPKSKKWEVHIDNHTPDRQLREQYGAKPSQGVTLYHADHIAPPHPNAPAGSAPRGGWRVERPSHYPGELRFNPTAWGNVIGHVPPHVMQQVHNAFAEVDKHAQNHADLYGQMAHQQDERADAARQDRDLGQKVPEVNDNDLYSWLYRDQKGDHNAAKSQWHRHPGNDHLIGEGYISHDKDYYLERGAPMVGGNTAWLVHKRIDPSEVESEGTMAWHARDGAGLQEIDGAHYKHVGDEGWLSDGKAAVEYHRKQGAKKQDGPSVSGVVLKAADTGRVLMLQRSIHDEKDPAAGTWEFPGGHHEDGDTTSLHAAIREWEEEVGQPFPEGGTVSHTWRSPNGVYQGHVVVIPEEKQVALHDGRVKTNPDDPDGDDAEQAAWWDPEHAKKNPALRAEVKKAPWDQVKKSASVARLGMLTRHFAAAEEPAKLPGGYLNEESDVQEHWAKPTGKTDYSPVQAHHGIQPKEDGHGPWHIVRHPETRAYHLIDNQGRSADQFGPTPGNPKYDLSDHNAHSSAVHAWVQANQDHGHIPKWQDRDGNEEPETGLSSRTHMGRGLRLPGTERARRKGEPLEDANPVDTQHVEFHAPPPPIEHTTEDPKVAEYKQRAQDHPAPQVHPAKTVQQSSSREHGTTYRTVRHGEPGYDTPGAFHTPSPEDEWHGPYRVIQHPETGKFHVADNQDRVTEYGGRGGMDEQHHAERMRDYADGRQASKERGKGIADSLWEGMHQIFDPGGTDESRRAERNSSTMSGLLHRYEGGDHHPLHPGRFGYDKDDEHDNGEPYYEVSDPHGSGWKARDYGGSSVRIHHEATGDQEHDMYSFDSQTGEKPEGFGHDELHQALRNFAHGDPSEPEDERYAPGPDYAEAEPKIKRWQQRKGYRG